MRPTNSSPASLPRRSRRAVVAFLAGALSLGLGLSASSALAGGKNYSIEVDAPAVKAGESAKAEVRITATQPWHMNPDFPTALKLESGSLSLAKTELKKADAASFDEHEASFVVEAKAVPKGRHKIEGTLRFAVCQDTACQPVRETVTVTLTAK